MSGTCENSGDGERSGWICAEIPGAFDKRAAAREPLAGHAGSCAKVTTATMTGKTDAACTCGWGLR